MNDKISDKQVRYLKMLMTQDYSLINDTADKLVADLLDKLEIKEINQLDKKSASLLINLLASLSKYQKIVGD